VQPRCRRKLASYIAYIPLPVVAGYLGYVGYFCIAAGAAQMSGKAIGSLLSWFYILQGDSFWQTVMGFACFAFIYCTLRLWKHPLCMPTVLCAVRSYAPLPDGTSPLPKMRA
jgi:sulfate permease, SulP family